MNIKLTKTFTGGPLAYLERWEKASIIYDNLSKNKVGMDDNTKRSFFIQMFHLTGVTETTLDLAVQSTNTFEDLCYAIRQKLAKKEHVEESDINLHANQASMGNQRNIDDEINVRANYISNIQMATAYINTLKSGEWNVGAKLWGELSTEQREMITDLRINGKARLLPNPNNNRQSISQPRQPTGISNAQQHQNNQSRPPHLRQNTSVLRPPTNNNTEQNRQMCDTYW